MGKRIMLVVQKILPLSVSAGILYYLLYEVVSLPDLRTTLFSISYRYLALALALAILGNVLLVTRWRSLLTLGGYKIAANLPIAKFTPGYTGDFLRSYFLRDKVPIDKHLGIISFEALSDVTALACIALAGSLILGDLRYIVMVLGILTGLILLFFIIVKVPHILPKKFKTNGLAFIEILEIFKGNPPKFAPVFFLTLFISFLSPVYVYLLFLSIGAEVSLLTVLALQPIVMMITLVPISFWGLGVRESAMLALYTAIAADQVVSTGLLYTIIGSMLIPLLCIPYTYTLIRKTLHALRMKENIPTASSPHKQ